MSCNPLGGVVRIYRFVQSPDQFYDSLMSIQLRLTGVTQALSVEGLWNVTETDKP